MIEQEKKTEVHHNVLRAQHKNTEQDRKQIAVQLAERKNKNRNLQIKYQNLIQKNKGDVNFNEHS